jgi:riboflavin kinase / FMN adenylyltransferase
MPLAILRSPEEWLARFGGDGRPSAVTIGNFDGVHLGHQQILRGVHERARAGDLMAAVLTFYPHPARVLRPDCAPSLLATLPQRLAAFDSAQMDAALILQFDATLASMPAEDFVKKFLMDTMRARFVLIGGNFRFGHRQAGDVALLEEMGRRSNFQVQVVPPVVMDGAVVSSTAIRDALRDGRVEDAARLLGRPFTLAGEIRTGTGMGRKLVVPTLNLSTEQETLPKNGVYATETIVADRTYRSATNIGMRPTFDGRQLAIESHLFDFSENLTSGSMEVRFCARLREEKKFSSPDALRAQILKDVQQAKRFFARPANAARS